MASNDRSKGHTLHQTGALVTLVAIAVWGLAILWLHFVTPAGAHVDEITPIATFTLLYWGLIPFYWKRARWSYVAGILALLGPFVIAVLQAQEGILFFSMSLYNIITILIYVVAAASIYFSLRSYLELPPAPSWRTLLGILVVVLIAGAVYFALLSNKNSISATMAKWTQNRIARKLENLETLDEKIQYLVAEGDIPSVAVGIVVDDQLVWSGAYGEQPDIDTIYNAGSIAKPVVATAVLQLYERGLIDLDADVNEYLPFNMRHPDYPDVPITTRMLLSHQSGLSHYTAQYASYIDAKEILDWETRNRGQTIYGKIIPFDPYPSYAEFLAGYLTPGGPHYSRQVWSTEPGTEFAYSSPGYDILGYLVEQVTGQGFSDYLQENIFDPLNMTSTGLEVAGVSDRQAIPYDQVYGILAKTNVRFPLYERKRIGGGGLNSTVADLAQFMIAHLNQGQNDGYQILRPETIALMHTRKVKASADVGMTGYGYGLNSMRTEPWEFYGHFYDFYGSTGHGGSDYGYLGRMFFVEKGEGGYGVIVLNNLNKYFKSDNTWFFGIYLKLDNLLMQEAEARFLQQAGQ